MVIFTEKEAPAGRYLAAKGLVKSRVAFFTEKNACSKIPNMNRACEIMEGHFHQKSTCGKQVSINRACQSLDHGCIMEFDNRKVPFRTDYTPLHRIAVQFQWAGLFGELQKNRRS